MSRRSDRARHASSGVAARLRAGLLLAGLVPWLAGWSFFDPFHENVEKGNRAATEGQADEALQRYGEAARVDPSSAIPDFNRGRVLAQQGETDAALDAFRAASASGDAAIAADALYNLGNVQLEAQEYEAAIESFLQSLDLDPGDADARRNLEIALARLEEQQQQEEQEQDQQQDPDDESEDEQNQQQEPRQDEPEDERDTTNRHVSRAAPCRSSA